MNNSKQPAFPTYESDKSGEYTTPGLTKREYFAAMAMQGIVSSIDSEENYQRLKDLGLGKEMKVSQWIAAESVKQADALLEALNQNKQP